MFSAAQRGLLNVECVCDLMMQVCGGAALLYYISRGSSSGAVPRRRLHHPQAHSGRPGWGWPTPAPPSQCNANVAATPTVHAVPGPAPAGCGRRRRAVPAAPRSCTRRLGRPDPAASRRWHVLRALQMRSPRQMTRAPHVLSGVTSAPVTCHVCWAEVTGARHRCMHDACTGTQRARCWCGGRGVAAERGHGRCARAPTRL